MTASLYLILWKVSISEILTSTDQTILFFKVFLNFPYFTTCLVSKENCETMKKIALIKIILGEKPNVKPFKWDSQKGSQMRHIVKFCPLETPWGKFWHRTPKYYGWLIWECKKGRLWASCVMKFWIFTEKNTDASN